MSSATTLSDLLGYTSIGCWLGAQFPQVLENIRRQSVEGLALPFLINWLLGDFTNLIGCILTRQLPFQTYLAAYFCFVDCALLSQYFYYRSVTKPSPEPFAPPYLSARPRTGSVTDHHHLSADRSAAHYRALSTVAANVAASAAIAAQKEEHARHSKHSEERCSTLEFAENLEDDDEVSDEALARLTESFHSERLRPKKVVIRSERGSSVGRHRQATLSPVLQMTAQSPQDGYFDAIAARGRPLERGSGHDGEEEGHWRTASTSAPRRSSRASRKRASMVFLGAWALFGIGTLAGGRHGLASGTQLTERVGRVLSQPDVVESSTTGWMPVAATKPTSYYFTPRQLLHMREMTVGVKTDNPSEEPSMEFIIGRISAWTCTTLYLTSRLPQIWKNYVRKSVEGLSVLLFVFAFLGNVFYVGSILSSPRLSDPPPQASAFIRESIPYLLGSGGTLMFDVTIVIQTFLYRAKSHHRGRRTSRSISEEEEALLSAGATGHEDSIPPSRRRMGSSTDPE